MRKVTIIHFLQFPNLFYKHWLYNIYLLFVKSYLNSLGRTCAFVILRKQINLL